ncbi:glycoside hydrolase [Acephala macrosclerotiorum]|nr:glycoside hydrolase [Acephala macrosclerotiorum]
MFYQTINWLDSTKELVSITLPNVTTGSNSGPGGAAVKTRLHLFSVSMLPATGSGAGIELEVQYARSTQMWMEGTNKTQIIEVVIDNVGEEWVLSKNGVKVLISSPGYQIMVPGYIKRLRPGDQARVQVGVVNADGVAAGTVGNATVVVSGVGVNSSYTFNATYGIAPYEATYESIYSHETPNWYNKAKYGIFIHWGVYAVPGWGNVGKNETYAEWYWYDQNLGPSTPEQTYQYNLATYGRDHVYDDFIQNFTASAFNPKEWVDLFSDAGANYFVQVSKHHDGYALFDLPANVTQRTSVAQHPHRNLLQELFDAAAMYQPQLHRATYFSLPEWFNPAYKEYGFGSWPGGNATNPYTNATLPYTGFVEVEDYVPDVILPEMNALADMGTEIMWCDIGGPNMTAEFASAWFNKAAESGRQVVMDNRCGLPGDFDTPEYARYDAVRTRKWESNLGMDPFSYGYNRATPTASYMNASTIITSLLDIVSKNGNFLLDIGPMANGTILDVEAANLREAGTWIKNHSEAIFNTTYWFITPEENGAGQELRFTQTGNAFYICSSVKPGSDLVIESPVPWVEGDNVTVVGGNASGTVVPSRKVENGSLVLGMDESVRNGEVFAWVFKISYGGTDNGTSTNGTSPGGVSSSGGGRVESVVMGAGLALLLTFLVGLSL